MTEARKDFISKCLRRSLLALVVGVGLLLCYGTQYIPIAGVLIARHQLSAYVRSQMPEVSIEAVHHDWYNSGYYADLGNDSRLKYNLWQNTIYDGPFNEVIGKTARADYRRAVVGQFPPELTLPDSIMVGTALDANDYTRKSQWLYVLGVYNTANLTEDESQKAPAQIAKKIIDLMGEDYHFTAIQLIYADKNGMYEIATLPADTFDPLTERLLLRHTQKRSEEQLPEDYLEWRARQNLAPD